MRGPLHGERLDGDLGRAGSGTSRRRPRGARGRASHREDLLRRAHPLDARVVVGAEQAQRQVRLRRKHEYEERRVQIERSAHQSQTDRDGDERDRDRRDTSSRISEDRNETRSVAIAARR